MLHYVSVRSLCAKVPGQSTSSTSRKQDVRRAWAPGNAYRSLLFSFPKQLKIFYTDICIQIHYVNQLYNVAAIVYSLYVIYVQFLNKIISYTSTVLVCISSQWTRWRKIISLLNVDPPTCTMYHQQICLSGQVHVHTQLLL